jgi:alpha-beta hydrolase superfamily lysophospholipase
MHTLWQRVGLCLALAAAMATFAPRVSQAAREPGTPHLGLSEFVTANGLHLPVRRWTPAHAPRAVVVALHGFNDYSNAFAAVPGAPGTGPYLAAHGFAVIAYDQRGFGQSPGTGRWAGGAALVTDFNAVVAGVKAENPQVPVFGLGESMGGAILMAAMAGPDPPQLAGLVLVAPAVWARSTMPRAYRAALWLGAGVAPGLRVASSSAGRQATDNLALLEANTRDPLFIKKTRLDTVSGLVDLMDAALAAVPGIAGPVLYLYGEKDQIIPQRASAKAMTGFTPAGPSVRLALYPNGWHMLLRDRQAEAALADVAAFLTDQSAPLPSGAGQDALRRLARACKCVRNGT